MKWVFAIDKISIAHPTVFRNSLFALAFSEMYKIHIFLKMIEQFDKNRVDFVCKLCII